MSSGQQEQDSDSTKQNPHQHQYQLHEQNGHANPEREAESALLSLGQSAPQVASNSAPSLTSLDSSRGRSMALSNCPKSHQLPLFLSKTYHMIDRCEPTIATWSMDGSNFVVKNVEKFATSILPLYFKHSNFSSFARQLNFYGFRKLRTDPILTSDVDPKTSCYVRFYHEKFQKDRPELLHQIKRATKSDQQSKDDYESLKAEVKQLRDAIGQLRDDTDRRLAEMSYECNRRITSMGAEYDKLASLVQQCIQNNATTAPSTIASSNNSNAPATSNHSMTAAVPSNGYSSLQNNPHAAAIAAAAAVAAGVPTPTIPAPTPSAPAPPTSARMPDLMESLSQAAAISLQQQQQQQAAAAAAAAARENGNHIDHNNDSNNNNKRAAEGEADGAPASKQTQNGMTQV